VAEPARSTKNGPGRVLVAVYAVFALSAIGRSSVQLLTKAEEAPVAYALSALAAVVYLAATLGLAEAVPRPRQVAWAAVVVELVGVLTVGTVSVVRPEWFPDATVWSGFGEGYGYLPAVLPVLGVAWLLRAGRGRDRPRPAARRPAA
jgi:hypothetical protein